MRRGWFLALVGVVARRSASWPVRVLTALIARSIPAAASTCAEETSFTCMGNGACVNGACYCDPGWIGSRCTVLDLLPVRQNESGWSAVTSSSWRPNWGGQIVEEGGTYYMVAGAKKNVAGSDLFSLNHHLALLSAPTIGGPYEFVSELATNFRIDLKRLADGSLSRRAAGLRPS